MEFLDPIATLLGITANQLVILGMALVVLTIGWTVLKSVIKLASKIFRVGCFTILLLGAGLYVYFVLLQ